MNYNKKFKKRNKGHSSSTQHDIKIQFKPEHFICLQNLTNEAMLDLLY